MKVAHHDDFDTHAVIGGKEVQSFEIAQTAEFFTVLSNTLYSNKPLAVIREVLCNAWDAQIVAGRTDRPVIVKIDEDKLSIRDFGHGIPHDLIHNIYCVYGNSTKENDGNQTGGFGLGSKSPFAYSDHFTVVNHHDGLKQVHAISRGSTMTQGKPDRRVMVSVPTTETGVEVIIPVKSREDMRNFIEITKDIAAFGEMNVLVNGDQVEVVPISTAENNMFLTTRKPRGSHSVINIRYGNVIYPVQPDVEYIGQWKRLKDILDDIPSQNRYQNGNNFCLILQAPPNSISVTPSRESLSNTETTIKTLRGLFTDIIKHMQTGSDMFEERLLDEQAKAINHLWAEGFEDRVWFSENLLTDPKGPKTVNDGSQVWTQITNMVEFAVYYLRYKEKISDKIRAKLAIQRVEMMLARGVRQPHFMRRYLRIMKKTNGGLGYSGKMFAKEIMRPLLRHVAKHEILDHKKLSIAQPSHRLQRYDWEDYQRFIPDNREFLKLLQGVVIITHNKLAYEEDWNTVTGLEDTIPNDQLRMVYVAPRTKRHKEAAVELFTKLGYKVIDFATMLDEHRAENREAPMPRLKSVAPARPKKIGLVPLSCNLRHNGQRFNMNGHLTEGAERIETYTHIVKPENLSGIHKRFFPWGDQQAAEIASLFGSKIGVCVSQPQYESQKKKGFGDGFLMIVKEVCSKVLTSPGIRTHVENNLGLRNTNYIVNQLLDMARYSTVLKKHFGLPDQNTEDDLNFYAIYESMAHSPYRYHYTCPADGTWEQVIYDTKEEVSKWSAAPAYALLAERVKDSRGLDYLDLSNMQYALRDLDKTNPDCGKKVFIETTLINALNLRK